MSEITPHLMLVYMSAAIFTCGLITLLCGVSVLLFRNNHKDANTLAASTSQIVNKSLAEDISGLVGNASALLSAMNDLSKTQQGTGVILIVVGLLLIVSSCSIVLYMQFGMPMS